MKTFRFLVLSVLLYLPFSLQAQHKIKLGVNQASKSAFVAKPSKNGKAIYINQKDEVVADHENNPRSMQRPLNVGYNELDILNRIIKMNWE